MVRPSPPLEPAGRAGSQAGRFRCRSRRRGPSLSVVRHGWPRPRASSSYSLGSQHTPPSAGPPGLGPLTSALPPFLSCPHHSPQPASVPPPSLAPPTPATCLSSTAAAGLLWPAFSRTGRSLCLERLSPAVFLAHSHLPPMGSSLPRGDPYL